MADTESDTDRLEMAHVLFMDLVGYSRLPLAEQSQRIEALQDIVGRAPTYRQAEPGNTLLSHPAGDGMALAFLNDPSAPARCALDIAAAVRSYDDLPLRMGMHAGPVCRAEDITRTANVRGPAEEYAAAIEVGSHMSPDDAMALARGQLSLEGATAPRASAGALGQRPLTQAQMTDCRAIDVTASERGLKTVGWPAMAPAVRRSRPSPSGFTI